MQNEKIQRTGFGMLLSRGWRLYGKSLGTTFSISFLCNALPSLLLTVVVYYCVATMFRPVFQVAQTVLQSLLTYGFDEWAIGEAVERLLLSIEGYTLETMLKQMLGSMGWLVVLLIVLAPVKLICQYVVAPVGAGAVAETQSRTWHGVKVGISAAFAAVKKRAGRLMVLYLVFLLGNAALGMVLSFASAVLSLIPVVGSVAGFCLAVGVAALSMGLQELMVLVAINEDKWHFEALIQALKRYFTDYAYIASGAIIWSGVLVALLLVAVLDVFLMILAMFPPVLTVLLTAFAAPLSAAITTVVYYDQRKREGYAPACAIE